MTDLSDSIPSLQRMCAPPGGFDTLFPEATDEDLLGYLMDGMAESQWDGFLRLNSYDEDGVVTPDLANRELALIVIYAGTRLLTTQLTNTRATLRAKAGPVEFETQNSAALLTEALKQLAARKKQIIDLYNTQSASSAFLMADRYVAQSLHWEPLYHSPWI